MSLLTVMDIALPYGGGGGGGEGGSGLDQI